MYKIIFYHLVYLSKDVHHIRILSLFFFFWPNHIVLIVVILQAKPYYLYGKQEY